LGLVARDKLDLATAEKLLSAGLTLAQAQDDQYLISSFLNYLSTINLQLHRLEQAIAQASSSLALRQELNMRFATPDNLATLAAAYLARGDLSEAMGYAAQIQAILEECGGEGPEFPQHDYFILYQILTAAGHTQQAKTALQMAYNLVIIRAEKIIDPALRQSFLERVVVNRMIVNSYQRMSLEPVV
jgi:hypothetical protein